MTKNASILAAAALLFAAELRRPKGRRSMTALVRRCRPVRQSRRARIPGIRRMTHHPEPAVRLPAMRGFRLIVTPTLRPCLSPSRFRSQYTEPLTEAPPWPAAGEAGSGRPDAVWARASAVVKTAGGTTSRSLYSFYFGYSTTAQCTRVFDALPPTWTR